MDARGVFGHLTRRTAGMVLHPRRTAREVAGDVKGVVGTGVGMGVGMAGHVVGGAVHRAGSLLDRGRDTTSDRIVDLVSDPRPVATSPEPGEPDKLHGDPVAPQVHEAARGSAAPPEPEELRTPSGIPAAGPGHNPSTGETTDLTQPGTEPIVAASTSKAIRKEAEMMRRAASTAGEDDRDA